MKRVLIVGKNSYLAQAFAAYASNRFDISGVSTSTGEWQNISFSGVDAVVNFAGIAHQKQTPETARLMQSVNCSLAVAVAEKARKFGAQYIYLSSMSVFGKTEGVIDRETTPAPADAYGQSKLQAEQKLLALSSGSFPVSVVRPPMVYGLHARGNFSRLVRLCQTLRVFPSKENQRSMIYVDHLSECLAQLIDGEKPGVFHPQNAGYVCTAELVALIAHALGKSILFTSFGNGLIPVASHFLPPVKKLFGDLVYDHALSEADGMLYDTVDFAESVIRSVGA